MSRRSVAAISLLTLLVVGCGSGERVLTAEEFIEEMNDHGAALELEPALTTTPAGDTVYSVSFTDLAPSAVGQDAPSNDVHGSATLLVVDDSDLAREEFARCEQAPALTCFRAANAVLRVEGLQSADRARITTALEGIAADGG